MKNLLRKLPYLQTVRIQQLRFKRYLEDRKFTQFAKEKSTVTYPFLLKTHSSLLRRKLGNLPAQYQENKIVNLKLASEKIDTTLIKPGQTFSFHQLVGRTKKKEGYLEGLQLSQGRVKTGIGGGLCQLANLILWMAWHSPLEVVERHHHSFDPFPDHQRVLPFGSGASIFYNYLDLRIHNPTQQCFQFKIHVGEKYLEGSLHGNQDCEYSYHILEKNHAFLKKPEGNFRQNEIWREVTEKKTGKKREELLTKNFSKVLYELPEEIWDEIQT